MTKRVLKSHKSKMVAIYMQSREQCVVPVITTKTLWQLMHLGTLGTRLHHFPKCMSCHKVIVVITGRALGFHDCIYISTCNCTVYNGENTSKNDIIPS